MSELNEIVQVAKDHFSKILDEAIKYQPPGYQEEELNYYVAKLKLLQRGRLKNVKPFKRKIECNFIAYFSRNFHQALAEVTDRELVI